MKPPDKILIFRITHINNLDHILEHGIYTANSIYSNPDYINIGDISLIETRKTIHAPNPPGGTLEDYIPFYLGPRSPMLYRIATGFDGVKRYLQDDIIYIVSSFDNVKEQKLPFFFTDGNARSMTTAFYTSERDFAKLDWDAIYAEQWYNDETDYNRKQKKQSELLIKDYFPVSCIEFLGVRSKKAEEKVLSLLKKRKLEIDIITSPTSLYYDNIR